MSDLSNPGQDRESPKLYQWQTGVKENLCEISYLTNYIVFSLKGHFRQTFH